MVSLNDVRPVLYVARLFGCGLYVVREDDIVLMRYARVYLVVFALLYTSFCVTNFCMLHWMDEVLGAKLLTLTVVRTALSYMCVVGDIMMTVSRNCKIRAALSHLRIFDRATRYKERKSTRTVRFIYWVVPFVNLLFWSMVGYITFCVEPKDSVFNGVTYAIVNACLSMQLITFASLSFLLYDRFQHLCVLMLMPEDGKIMVVDRSSRQLHLQEVWWLHSCLADATEMLNSAYAVQLLLWIACMSFNLLSRIYTIGAVSLSLLIAREFLLVSSCVANLLIITVFCHMTACEANRVSKVAFSPSSTIIAKRTFIQTDCYAEAVAYFQIRQVHFFAYSGIIRIDLPLLLSIIAGITTYVVILRSANIA